MSQLENQKPLRIPRLVKLRNGKFMVRGDGTTKQPIQPEPLKRVTNDDLHPQPTDGTRHIVLWNLYKGTHRPAIVAVIDAEDWDRVNEFSWFGVVRGKGRSKRTRAFTKHPTQGYTQISRVILGLTDPKIHGHHIDHDPLNNRRSNLEALSASDHAKKHHGRKQVEP
jgi:hypothetical protein